MKKFSLLIALIFAVALSAVALSPKEVEGTWESKWTNLPSPDRSVKMKQKEQLNISADGTYTAKDEMQMTIIGQPAIDVFMYAEYSGTWAVEADSLSIHIDPATIKLDFPESEIRISGLTDPNQESMIKSQIHYNMGQMAKQMKKEIKDFAYHDVVVVNEKKARKLTCNDPENKVKYEFVEKVEKKKK